MPDDSCIHQIYEIYASFNANPSLQVRGVFSDICNAFDRVNLMCNVNLFPDDTSMFSIVSDPINTSQKLNKDLDEVSLWLNKWKISRSF